MVLLGVDFGLKKIGLALSESGLAYPFKVIRFQSDKDALKMIANIVEIEKVKKAVFGITGGSVEKPAMEFAEKLKDKTSVKIDYWDETLTTQEAQKKAIEAGIKRVKRRSMEDAYAATLMLQDYLDSAKTLV